MMKTKTVTVKTPEALAHTLGLSGLEAPEWQVQHELLTRLRQIVAEGALTHAEVAKRGGSSRTRVTSILNGNLDNVSSDLLIRLIAALSYRVSITVARTESSPGPSEPPKPKMALGQFLLESPLRNSGLKVERQQDYPRPIEL
ncbi:MAG: XRE family transcriptional regulator [Acidobacteria bacterium]|nr:XRE family transcriptional regulator [Acidobacteriota bacterium]